MREHNYYFDMDGVLADFFGVENAVERFENELDFFYNLQPIKANVRYVKQLLNLKNVNVFIISASPNDRADKDKIKWLNKYLPNLKKENIIIVRNGVKKLDYMITESGKLFDDYGKNINEWLENPLNSAVKVKGSIK